MNEGKQLTERKDERISVLVKVIHLYAHLFLNRQFRRIASLQKKMLAVKKIMRIRWDAQGEME